MKVKQKTKLLKSSTAIIMTATLIAGMSAISVSAETRDEYEYTVENGNATITKYNGNL